MPLCIYASQATPSKVVPQPAMCSLFRVNRDVSEDIVKEHMNGKDLKYLSIKTMSKVEAFLSIVFNYCGA